MKTDLPGWEGLGLRYGDAEANWLREQASAFWDEHDGEFECVDNARVCRVGDEEDEARYDEEARTGCCGSHEDEVGPSPGGHRYRHGFNHGH